MARNEEEKDSSIYMIVFGITIALFLFIGYQGYNRYFKKTPVRRPMAGREKAVTPVSAIDDGYDRAPTSLPPLRVDGGLINGRLAQ